MTIKGVMDINYHYGRKKRIDYRYRLRRRTYEVIEVIKKFFTYPTNILDMGAADGLMLSKVKKQFPNSECLGIEYSSDLIASNKDGKIKIIQGDVQQLTFDDNSFDIIIATAIIEHLAEPEKMIAEAYRVLKKEGLLIITTPNPFFEKIAGKIGGVPKEGHQTTFNLKKLNEIFTNNHFKVVLLKKFMLSPIGFPLEILIEKLLNTTGLNFTLLNQLIVGKK